MQDGEAIQISPGGPLAVSITGGVIYNPLEAVDQGLVAAESLFVDFTGPAYSYATETTIELEPGESIDIPANCTTGAWVCAASGGHKFTCVLEQAVESVTLSTDVMVQGSFHYESIVEQREDATVDANEVIFTSLSETTKFSRINRDSWRLGRYDDLTFAFSSRASYMRQADLVVCRGKALFSTKVTQVISDPKYI